MSNTAVDILEAERNFSELTPLIRKGETITLCDANQPIAEIRPLPRPMKSRRPFGLARGIFSVPLNFGEPDQGIERMFYGETE
jgi:antitoxin (DNA-binding transcriptional repressor) of toxin-antitoxin stability system